MIRQVHGLFCYANYVVGDSFLCLADANNFYFISTDVVHRQK